MLDRVFTISHGFNSCILPRAYRISWTGTGSDCHSATLWDNLTPWDTVSRIPWAVCMEYYIHWRNCGHNLCDKEKTFFFLCCGLWFLLTQLVHEQEQVCLWLNTWARHTTSDRNWLSLYSSSRFPCRDDLLWNRSVLLQQVDDRVQIRNCQTKWMPCRCFASPRNRRGFTLKIWSRWSEKV